MELISWALGILNSNPSSLINCVIFESHLSYQKLSIFSSEKNDIFWTIDIQDLWNSKTL